MAKTLKRDTSRPPCNWPASWLFAAWAVSAVIVASVLPDFSSDNLYRMFFMWAIWLIVMLRWVVAIAFREQSRGWIAYAVILVLSPILWLMLEVFFPDWM